MLSSLGSRGPSPSELVSARTMWTCQPSGVASRIRVSPSGVSAQFRARAARSTTSNRASFNVRSPDMDGVDLLAAEDFLGDHVELPRGSGKLELEDAVFCVVVDVLPEDLDPARRQERLDVIARDARVCPDRAAQHTPRATQLVLERPEAREHHRDERARTRGLDIPAGADRDADRRHHPDRGCGRQPGDRAARLHDGPGADEADARDDLRRQTSGVPEMLTIRAKADRQGYG